MKHSTIRIIAMALLIALLATLPMTAFASSKKSGTVKIKKASVSVSADGVSLNIKWKKVSKAAGYEYAYNLFYSKDCTDKDYTFKATDSTGATIRLKDYGTIDIKVRAYRVENGQKVYGKWSTARLKRSNVDKLVVKQLKKTMKKHTLFMRADSNSVEVHSDAGTGYGVVGKMNKGDECRATGKFKRDSNGTWWAQIIASIDQNTSVKGWVSRKDTDPVWY